MSGSDLDQTRSASTASSPTQSIGNASREPGVGDRIGQYLIESVLGKGGMGVVYRGLDTVLRRPVAMKVVRALAAELPAAQQRFDREAVILAALHHEGIAQLFALERTSMPVMVMEFIDGTNLRELVKHGPQPLDEVIRIGDAIAAALESAHERGVLHRDLKPENVMKAVDGRIKVLDFGVAKLFGPEPGDGETPLTESGVILGTPDYMSPEQATATKLDARTDIWSWGCVMFELLSGRKPFGSGTRAQSFANILHSEPDWQAVPPDVPAAIKTLLKECLAKNRDHRPNSMVDVRRRLYEALRQKPAVVAARQPASEAAARFQTLLRHMQDTDDADSAAIRLTTEYARRLSVAITDLAESGVLHGQSKASIKTTAGGVFALTPGFRAPRIAGGALTLSVRTIDDRLYAMCESHVQVEIAEPPDRSVLVRWLPVVETSRQPETVRRFQLDQLLPQLSADLLETIDTAPILEPTMQLLLARAEARMIQTGYRVPAVVAPAAAMPVPTSQVGTIDRFPDLQPVARELLATILRQSHPRDNYHGFWGAGTFGGWHLILAARRGAPGGDRAIDELTGRFELSDLEELCANGYIRLEEQGPSEVRGTILAKAYAEYDKRPS